MGYYTSLYYIYDPSGYLTPCDLLAPNDIVAGDSFDYLASVPEYPADQGNTLNLTLAGPSILRIVALPSGSNYEVKVTAAQTAALKPGQYKYAVRMTNTTGASHTVRYGEVVVRPNLDIAQAGEQMSTAERKIKMIDALLEKRVIKGVDSFTIDGILVKQLSISELQKARTQALSELMHERYPENFFGKNTDVRFTSRTWY